MTKDTLSITDNRTGKAYEIPIKNGTINAIDIRQIKTAADDFGLMSYDPAYTNTASCTSRITFIDGDVGILNYRGYPIEQLAEQSNHLETAYLLVFGELPDERQYQDWIRTIHAHTIPHENVKKFFEGFSPNAHPMAILSAMVASFSTYYSEADDVDLNIVRLLAKAKTTCVFTNQMREKVGVMFGNPATTPGGKALKC